MTRADRLSVVAALVGLGLAWLASSALAHPRCGTVDRLAETAANRVPIERLRHGVAAKQTRDGFGGQFEVRESANFALKWTDAEVTGEVAAAWLEGFEASWTFYHQTMGHRLSTGADQFRVNVYLHAADDNPSIDYAGGYVTLDDQGYPYVVIAEEFVAGVLPIGLIAHEFYHVVQMGTGSFDESFDADWYWEASAEWAAQESAADDVDVWGFIGAYAAAPELPLWYFGDFLATDVSAVHQYGASIFVRYLSERFSRDLIRDSWETAGDATDPLAVLESLVDGSIDGQLFADFAARNAFWDYRNHADIAEAVDWYSGERSFPAVAAGGTGGLVGGSDEHPLHSLGWTRIDLGELAGLAIEVEVEAADGVIATVARQRGDGVDYFPVADGSTGGSIDLELAAGDAAMLIVAAASRAGDDETFDYRYSVVEADASGLSAGCTTGSGGNGGSALILLALVAIRRSRA